MKNDTITYHKEAIRKMMDYINENLFNRTKLSIKELGEVALVSPRHAARIFKADTGETPGQYILRLRLEAARQMLISGMSIWETSEKLEYKNCPAFSAEYKNHFGYPPSKEGCASQPKYQPLKKQTIMKLKEKIINLDPLSVIFVQSIGNYSSNAPEKAWNTLWDFVEKKNLDVEKSEYFGIVHDDTEVTKATQCRYDACITVPKDVKPEGKIGNKTLDRGKYAVFTHKGPYKTLEKTYDQIFGPWLSGTKEQLADLPVLEKYLNDPFDTKAEDLITEIYVPIV
ncbi:MAG TPA: GyrI-like domain-containing protein [Bacteroidales bacterium]|nr:GyrI-like domain-containing protein [Bacteroidales bacterium]HQN17270.1 GyrI-like domain-containing protein [Bacteroidales bacterium]HQP16821.1 GyrI-like domain-containing protein [Bacteroidales bacterium]